MTRIPFVDLDAQRATLDPALADACLRALSQGDYILDSYRSLFLQHREACGSDSSDMVFGTEAALLRAAASD